MSEGTIRPLKKKFYVYVTRISTYEVMAADKDAARDAVFGGEYANAKPVNVETVGDEVEEEMRETDEKELPEYTNNNFQQFVEDMHAAGITVEHYRGRWHYEGPAVWTSEKNGPTLQDVMSATKVRVQKDNCAFDWIVYPVA